MEDTVIGRYSEVPDKFLNVESFHTMRGNHPADWLVSRCGGCSISQYGRRRDDLLLVEILKQYSVTAHSANHSDLNFLGKTSPGYSRFRQSPLPERMAQDLMTQPAKDIEEALERIKSKYAQRPRVAVILKASSTYGKRKPEVP